MVGAESQFRNCFLAQFFCRAGCSLDLIRTVCAARFLDKWHADAVHPVPPTVTRPLLAPAAGSNDLKS